MALTIRRTGRDDYSRFIKALIVGSPGAGKTLTSSTWRNPLIASAEGGLMSIADRNTPYVEVRDTETLFQLKIMLDQDPATREQHFGFRIDTVVIDTIDEIQKILIRERLDEGKKEAMELRDWGWLGEQMRSIIRGFRNLDLNVVLTCHMKESSDSESGRLYFVPAMQGAIGDELPALVDLALLLKASPMTEIVDGEAKRVMALFLQTYPDHQHPWIKDRSGKLPAEFEINFTDDYQRMYDLIYGQVESLPTSQAVVTGNSAEIEDEVTVVDSAVVDKEDLVMETQVAIDEPKPAPKAKVKEKTAAPAPETQKIICESCDGVVENEDQADISRIRFRKVMCRECFVAAKSKK